MKKTLKHLRALMLAIVLTGLSITPTFAAVSWESIVDTDKTGMLTIDYKEDVEGTDPVAGAGFTIYKVADLLFEGNYSSIIDGIETVDDETDPSEILDIVKEAYEGDVEGGYTAAASTGADGMAYINGIPLGLYIVEESDPAADHFASVPFLAAMPYTTDGDTWEYSITAEPKSLPAGTLTVEKTVVGDAGETDRDFHFTVTLDGYDETIEYVKSDGTTGTFNSGDTVTLKHGESVTFKMIPVGTAYTVVEEEADEDGYTTEVSDGTGNIKRTVEMTASFWNTKKTAPDTGDTNTVLMSAIICLTAAAAMAILGIKLKSTFKKKGEKR